ncbi:NADPH-dependent F420 reductase [Streptomyces sp. NPDC002577]
MTTFGIIGAGEMGVTIAQAVIGLGHDVVIANSREPETLATLVAKLGPKARAATAVEAGEAADVAVVAVPWRVIYDIPVEPLAGKIVIDPNNYSPLRDGVFEELERGEKTTSELLQAHLPTSKVVKAFSHLNYFAIITDGAPAGSPNRRALGYASDYREAAEFVADLYERLGFDAVDTSPLSESWRLEHPRPAYPIARVNKRQLSAYFARAKRIA